MGRPRKNTIKPFTKTAPAVSLDKIPDTASLDDYEKMISKMANSSDDIIDAALDKMEGRQPKQPPAEPRQEPLQEPPEDVQPQVQERPPEEEAPATKQPAAEAAPQQKVGAVDSGIGALKDKMNNLQTQLDQLTAANMSLSEKIGMYKQEIEGLVAKNDDLILRNSELEFEISRVNTENTLLKRELESLGNAKRLPPQTSSRSGYTPTPQTPRSRAPQFYDNMPRPPKLTMNGYESWN